MREVTTVGVDLAKSVFTAHGVDAAGHTVLRKTVRRERLMELMAALPPCRIGLEAWGGAHEWARRFAAPGHRVGIMMARFEQAVLSLHRVRQGVVEQRTATINRIRGLLAEFGRGIATTC